MLESFFGTSDLTFQWLGVFAVLFAGYMAWMIGSNDIANAMATSVGSKALTYTQAVIIAGIADFLGAVLAGGTVTDTVRKGIVDSGVISQNPDLMIVGMVAAMLSAGIWLHLATHLGLPVSTTHSIVGAIVGFALIVYGIEAVQWNKVVAIVLSWILSPVGGGIVAAGMYIYVRRFILTAAEPMRAMRLHGPFLGAVTIWMIVLAAIWKGLKKMPFLASIDFTLPKLMLISLVAAIIGYFILFYLVRRVIPERGGDLGRVERIFIILQVITATYVAFSHGANDVANAIGPLAAVLTAIKGTAHAVKTVPVPLWVLVYGGAGIALGLAFHGSKVMKTVGEKITEITPSRGFSAEFAAATVVTVFSKLGMPVSTTHTLVGSVMGVGIAQGLDALNLRVLRSIMFSWLLTLPVAAILCMVVFWTLRLVLGI